MKRPTWATVVGVLGIIFACSGILGAGQEIFMPKIMQMQKELFSTLEKASTKQQEMVKMQKVITDELEKDSTKQQADKKSEPIENSPEKKHKKPAMPPEMVQMMQKMWEFPDWFGPWSIFTGVAKALISAIYLLASIWLLQTKPAAIALFYWAAGASCFLSILKGVVAFSALSSFMGLAMMSMGVFGGLIDLVLIIVVLTGDKAAFQSASPQPVTAE